MAEMDMLAECPFRKGRLGRWRGPCLSTPKEELLRDFSSKWPDLFSRRVVAMAKPESLLETGVEGIGGKFIDMGETDDGGLVRVDLLVPGRSDLLLSVLACEKALKTGGLIFPASSSSPKAAEFCAAHLPRVLSGGMGENMAWSSAEKASYGKDSMA